MKKTLIFTSVLVLISAASASLSFELRETNGTPIPGPPYYITGDCTLVIMSDSATATTGGLYGPTYTSADWVVLGPADSNVHVLDTGNLSNIYWYAAYNGYEFVYDDLMGDGISTGDIFAIDLMGLATGDFRFDLYDSSISSYLPVQSIP